MTESRKPREFWVFKSSIGYEACDQKPEPEDKLEEIHVREVMEDEPREAHYEKLWRAFVSLQKGDVQQMPIVLDRTQRALEKAKKALRTDDYYEPDLEEIEAIERGEG